MHYNGNPLSWALVLYTYNQEYFLEIYNTGKNSLTPIFLPLINSFSVNLGSLKK